MKPFLSPNIDRTGRIVRGIGAALLLAGSAYAFTTLPWLGVVLLAAGIFVAFEALRGWCALRACGVRTKL
jgi:Protein of unknown function (DUF2892)